MPAWTRAPQGNLTRKQVLALSRALKRQGRKLPKVGWCANTTKEGGRYSRTRSGPLPTSEVCHHIIGGKHVYTAHLKGRGMWHADRQEQRTTARARKRR